MRWLGAVTFAIVLALAAARCSRDVDLGVDPSSVGADGGAGDGGAD